MVTTCQSRQLWRGTSRQVYHLSKVGQGSQKGKEGYLAGQRLKTFCATVFWQRSYDNFGKINRARIIRKGKAHVLLKAKMETEGWGADYYRSVQLIGGHYSQFKKIMQLKSWKALKQQDYELEYDDGFPSDTDSDA